MIWLKKRQFLTKFLVQKIYFPVIAVILENNIIYVNSLIEYS